MRSARRALGLAAATAAALSLWAAPAFAHDCDVYINPEDCENTAWTVGVIATISAGAAAATGLARNGKLDCTQLRAAGAKLAKEEERLRNEARACQATLGQIHTAIARAEEDHRDLVRELERTLPYFIGAGALAGAALASLAGSLFGAIGRGFTSIAQAVGEVNVTAGLSGGGTPAITNALTGELIVPAVVSPAQAALNTQAAVVAENLASASYWYGLVPTGEVSVAGGAAAGGLTGGVVQRMMNRALADHLAALQRQYRLESEMEQVCQARSEALDAVVQARRQVAERLKRDCD